jgi:hypothetical protein
MPMNYRNSFAARVQAILFTDGETFAGRHQTASRDSLSLAHLVTIIVRGYEDVCTRERAGSCLPETRKLPCSARSAPALPLYTPSRGEPCCAWTETSRGSTARRSSAGQGACPTRVASDFEPAHKSVTPTERKGRSTLTSRPVAKQPCQLQRPVAVPAVL